MSRVRFVTCPRCGSVINEKHSTPIGPRGRRECLNAGKCDRQREFAATRAEREARTRAVLAAVRWGSL